MSTEDPRPFDAADFGAIIPPPGAHQCRLRGCDAVVERPGICAACGAGAEQRAHDAELKPALTSIPERFRWATLERLVASEHRGRVTMPPRHLAAADRLRGYRVVVIVGEGSRGKTSLACAVLRAVIDAGTFRAIEASLRAEGELAEDQALTRARSTVHPAFDLARRARFVPARDVFVAPTRDDIVSAASLATCMPVVLLDDVGQDGGAGRSYRDDDRCTEMSRILQARHDMQGRAQTIVTTWGRRREWERWYGDGAARRYFDGTDDVRVLDLDRLAEMSSARPRAAEGVT